MLLGQEVANVEFGVGIQWEPSTATPYGRIVCNGLLLDLKTCLFDGTVIIDHNLFDRFRCYNGTDLGKF